MRENLEIVREKLAAQAITVAPNLDTNRSGINGIDQSVTARLQISLNPGCTPSAFKSIFWSSLNKSIFRNK
jgi:hypothetical protein